MEKVKLDSGDWGVLLAGKSVKVGNKILTVVPSSIRKLAALKSMLNTAIKEILALGITAEKLEAGEGYDVIFEYVASNCPVLIEEACGLHRGDVPDLPIATGVTLMTEIINVNIDSQEGLMEALSFLGKLLTTK